MFGRVLSALFSFAGWLVKSTLVKFALYFGLFFVTTEFIALLVPLLPGASSLAAAFANQADGVWYLLDIFQIPFGIKVCLGAYVTRFMIRRMPIIG